MKKIIEYKYFFAVLFLCIITHYLSNFLYNWQNSGFFYELLHFIIRSAPIFSLWLYIGYKTNNKQAGLYAGITYFIPQFIFYYFHIYSGYFIITIASVFVFSNFSLLRGRNKVLFIVATSSLLISSHNFSNYEMLLSLITRGIGFRVFDSQYLFSYFSLIGSFSLILFFIPVLFKTFNFEKKISDHDLFPKDYQSLLHNSFVYFFFFWSILVTCFNIGTGFMEITRFFANLNEVMESSSLILVFNTLISFTSVLMGLYFIAWYYRKIMLQYLIQNNLPISCGYYFSQFPIIRLILWILAITFKSDKKLENHFIKSSPNGGILVLMFVFILGKLFFSMDNLNMASLIEIIIGVCFLFIFVNSEKSIYFLNGIRITALILLLFFINQINYRINSDLLVIAIILPIYFMIIQYPIFHLGAFKIIDNTEEEDE